MAIYPDEFNSRVYRKSDAAALDIDVPDVLLSQKDIEQWSAYLDCLAPARMLEKFACALDDFHSLVPENDEFTSLSTADKITAYSKWEAASTAAGIVLSKMRLNFDSNTMSMINSDVSEALMCVIDLLEGVKSPESSIWSSRLETHNQIDEDKILKFLNNSNLYKKAYKKSLGNGTPSP